jgi:hypothetical protein
MKKILSVFVLVIILTGCYKEDILTPSVEVVNGLKIANSVGIKLETVFVTSEVAMNVKTETAGTVTIRIFDIANTVVSKETMKVNAGDNILKVHASTLPSSAYRIGLYNVSGRQLGITDFNKL